MMLMKATATLHPAPPVLGVVMPQEEGVLASAVPNGLGMRAPPSALPSGNLPRISGWPPPTLCA